MEKTNLDVEILSGRDIVVIGIQPWHYVLGSNCKNIALQFSKTNRVLYVNIPLSRKTIVAKDKTEGVKKHCSIIKENKEQIYKINELMWEFYPASIIEPINSLPSTRVFKFFNRINNKRYAKDIQYAIKKLGFENIILFNDNDFYTGFHLKELLKPELTIYYCRDFLQGNKYWKKHARKMEPALIANADLVVANSTYYADYCSTYNKDSYYIGQGCNLELFNKSINYKTPEDIIHFSSPIIGYVGAVDSDRLDLAIIRTLANSNKDWNIILVGPEDDIFKSSDLHQLENIKFLGRKDINELPAYINKFNVCINPQLINQLTIGNYPLKVDEYLAMGKPVVATRTKAMEIFEKYTYLAETPAEYPALIAKALKENSPTAEAVRIAFANSHTWENCMKELYKLIHRYSSSSHKKA